MKKQFVTLGTLIIGFAIGASALTALAQWNPPSTNPPMPNVAAPVNVGGAFQLRTGKIGIGATQKTYTPESNRPLLDVDGSAIINTLGVTGDIIADGVGIFGALGVNTDVSVDGVATFNGDATFNANMLIAGQTVTGGLTVTGGSPAAGKILSAINGTGATQWVTPGAVTEKAWMTIDYGVGGSCASISCPVGWTMYACSADATGYHKACYKNF